MPRIEAGLRAGLEPLRGEPGVADVRDQVAEVVPEAAAITRIGTPALDVRAGVLAQLRRHGVSGTLVGGCTYEDPALYSFRRDATTGRQAALIVLRHDDRARGAQ